MRNKKILTAALTAAVFFIFACVGEPEENKDHKKQPEEITTFIWTFQKPIPNWVEFNSSNTKDFPEGTTMNIDADYYGMTLLASQRTTRWYPNEPSPADSGFSKGFIQPNGATAEGKYSLKIENVKGPFKLTINYTARNEGQKSAPLIFIDGKEKHRGVTADENTPLSAVLEYMGEETVTISLGNAPQGIRIYDVILYAPENKGNKWGDNSGKNNDSDQPPADEIDVHTGSYPDNWINTPAFPGAEGFGRYASGGRGGKTAAVTNLNDSGEGSLRWAMEQHKGEPLTVVFRVSGVIKLESELRVKRDNYTLAGQTSPNGICVTGNKVNLGGSNNVIVRHLRFRIGAENGVYESAFGMENASIFIIDHCTFGWSGEENMTVYDNDLSTVQWCIIHEGLYNSGHPKGARGYGVQWGGKNATYHHNLLAHNDSRSPRLNGARSGSGYPKDNKVMIDFVNNVNFNWGRAMSSYGGDITYASNTHSVNFVNNYWKPGPAYPVTNTVWFMDSYFSAADGCVPGKISVWWMNGNIMEGKDSFNANNYEGLNTGRHPAGTDKALFTAAKAFNVLHPVTAQTAQQAYESVLENSGAFPRDSVDARIVSNVRNPSGITFTGNSGRKGIIDRISDAGGHASYINAAPPADTDGDGMPDDWETEKGLNPNNINDGNLKTLNTQYTNLEVYLNELEALIRQR